MKTTAPLSKEQYGLYVECLQHENDLLYYNVPYLYILDKDLDQEKLRMAIQTTVFAHPTLFTRIELDADGEPLQTIDMEKEQWQLEVENVDDIEEVKSKLIEPYNLFGDRLFHIRLLRDINHFYFFLGFHHIIGDGTSLKVILEDIEKAYAGEELKPEELTMADVAIAEAELRQTDAFQKGKKWYEENFDSTDCCNQLLPDLELPEYSENHLLRTLDIDMAVVDNFCKENGIFKSTLFTTAYSFLLAKYNNENESVFTTIYNGRNDKRFNHSVGMTVKTLPVYAKFDNETTVLDFLKHGQDQMRGCREHDIYAYSDVVKDLGIQTNSMFAWHGMLFSDEKLCGKPMKTIRLCNSTLESSLYLKAYILNGKYQVKAEYNSNEYSEALISQFLESYEAVLEGFVSQKYLRDINITTSEQTKILDTFNQTDIEYDDTQTIVSLFRRQASATPDNIAVVFKDRQYTYAQVDDISDRIATYIVSKGLGTEDVVSVLIPRCEWMAIASLGILKAGCAYQPLDPTYPKERLNFMMKDADARLLIADKELRDIVDEYQGDVLLTDELSGLSDKSDLPNIPKPEDLFILLYTSGSTGVPKGCQLIHSNLVAFCHWYHRYYDLQSCHKVAAYASYGFDACMMDMYPALTCGATLYIIPEEIRLDLIALNGYFEQNGITHSFMTTQVGYQFATGIENHSLIYLSTGGEKLASLTPPANYKFINIYGPTECTICITNYHVEEKLQNIPIGKALDNAWLYIVDAQGNRLPVGASGELWVSGPQVSRGYLNRPEKTAEVYISNPFTSDKKHSKVYRTGDIVRYLPSGDIQFVGRRDGQVKIRGFRIELKEVESIIREFPDIKDATVQAFEEENGSKFIAAYLVSDKQIDIEALNQFILDQKPPYMVPAVTMQIESIPLNQNQKVNKKALPKPEKKAMTEEQNTNVKMNVLEEQLHELIASVIHSNEFGITTPLNYAGLDSISSIHLAISLNKRFGVELNAKALLKTGTLQSIENEILSKMLQAPDDKQVESNRSADGISQAPLTFAQTGVYFECLKNPVSTIYNIPYLLRFPKDTDVERLTEIVKQVTLSHPEMSISCNVEGDSVVQSKTEVPVVVPVSEMSEEQLEDYKHTFPQPFNLQKAPLYRFEIVRTPEAICLLLDVHHLIFDGTSADIFIRQICGALEGKTVENEKYTYFDFATRQQKAQEEEQFKQAEQFFDQQLQTCEGASEIPADLPKTDQQGFIGEAVALPDYDKATLFCRQQGITPAHLFLAATAYVVSRYTNNREVYLCTISSGRSNLKIADTVGMFVNTLALAVNINDLSIKEFLQEVSNNFDETLAHEDYPFARIAAKYSFQPAIAYAYQVGVLSKYTVNGQTIEQELLELNVPKFKINIKIETRGVVVQYDDSLYSQELAQALADSIVAVSERMIQQPQDQIRKISIVSKAQETQLSQLREVATGDAPFKLFHQCISHFAKTQPDHEALVATDAAFTYKEMDEVTNKIAAELHNHGVQSGDRVALLLPRTSRLILSLFGVLKAGAAYIPCDPDYPADRIKLILEDSEARYIITTTDRLETVPEGKGIDVEQLINGNATCESMNADITPDDLAYLIYTSGSTGRPKGVMLRHEGICNYLYGHPANVFANAVLTDAKRILSVTTISFDAALQDIGMAFFNGKTLIVATEEQANNPLVLANLIQDQHINMVSGTPSRWQTWLTSDDFCKAIAGINICRAGGEKFSDSLLGKMRSITKARIFNCYGPTEITVASNNKELTNASMVTVGKPQLNVKEFIVDTDGNELPVGVVGELYIGGRGVARGYNNLEQMTAERFIQYHGERVYRSGDYAKWLPDGDVVILGRTDNQIKLRGLRIELGEIENVMLKVSGMKKVVITIRNINGKEHLCAYYSADHEIQPDTLKNEIAKSLTQYMVPTAYMQMQTWPMTPNGKTDIRLLPEPVLAVSAAYEAPANSTEKTFCDIFAGILQMDKVGATDNFFELGGTSLVVMQVIIEAEKAGKHIAYGDVFANPTPRQLAALFEDSAGAQTADSPEANFDYTAINNLLQRNTLSNFKQGKLRPLGDVMLTGATGYLGIHILRELIDSDATNIYCLVRGKTVEKAQSRLQSLLYYYFSDAFKSLFGTRIHVITGDVTADFGEDIHFDTLFNCAAIVKHFSEGTEIEDVNIGGANRCVELCIRKNARLIHVSTASTRGIWAGEKKDEVFTEQKLYMGQYLGNKYIFSKFMAERNILNAVALHGLDAKIMRVGNLAARSTDGEFQANFKTNSFMGRLRIYNMLGCCPYSMRNKRVEFSPINEVSHAIVLLASTPEECTVFHPYNIHGQFLGDVLMGLSKVGEGIRFVEQEEFQQAMEEAKADPQKAQMMTSMLAYQDMAHGQKTTDVERDNDYTTQVLYRLGFAFSPTSWDYVERMLTAIGAFGFFE